MSQVIRELRRQRKSYREIAQILRDEHGISADRTTIWSFVKVRSKPRRVLAMSEEFSPSPVKHLQSSGNSAHAIEALKAKPMPTAKKPRFIFDENKPLTLQPETL